MLGLWDSLKIITLKAIEINKWIKCFLHKCKVLSWFPEPRWKLSMATYIHNLSAYVWWWYMEAHGSLQLTLQPVFPINKFSIQWERPCLKTWNKEWWSKLLNMDLYPPPISRICMCTYTVTGTHYMNTYTPHTLNVIIVNISMEPNIRSHS